MSCGHKLQDYLQFRWPWSEKHNPIELLTLTIDSSVIRDFSTNAFSLSLFGSLASIHIKNNELASFNEVQLQTRTFSGLPSLEIISVVNNTNLEVVPTRTFSYLPQLTVINLTNNSIKDIKQRAFGSRIFSVIDPKNVSFTSITELGAAGSLPLLTVLDLSHNSLQSLPGQDILELSNASLKYLYLEGNPWNCSCEMMTWILDLNTSILVGPPGVCHHPPELRGTALHQLNLKDFKHCFPSSLFSITNIIALVTIAAITALLVYQICNRRSIGPITITFDTKEASQFNQQLLYKVVVGEIEYDTSKRLGFNVYKGKLLRNGRPVAVKKVPHFQQSKELDTLLRMSSAHTNVIQCLWKEDDEETLFIAFELGKANLRDLIQAESMHLTLLTIKDCLRQITEGICHLHECDPPIEHRDIKPTNILWTIGKSGKRRFFVCDFDLSRICGEMSSHKSHIGTEGWSAPELWETGTGERNTAADIFSLGCVYFYVLTRGRHPFGMLNNKRELQNSIMRSQFSLGGVLSTEFGDYEAELAKDLIVSMIQSDISKRLTACETLKHPFYWTPGKITKFYDEVGNFLDAKQKTNFFIDKLEQNSDEVIQGDWYEQMTYEAEYLVLWTAENGVLFSLPLDDHFLIVYLYKH